VGALAVGVLTYAGGRYGWANVALPFEVLFAFFITSVAFSYAGRKRKALLVDIPKGGPRDAWQVAANGGIATLCAAIAALLTRGTTPSHLAYALLWAFAGAYAAATADTWSTEIGSAFGGKPRSIIGLQPIATGLSGGITPLGTLAMLAGAAWIAFVFALSLQSSRAFWIVTLAGVAGALADSLLGATLQSIAFCPACKRPTETAMHVCGTRTTSWRGLRWMTNDAVNALAALTGSVVCAVLFLAG
jgi:uncharacterized protein (TIGR00297 family)